MNNGRPIGEHYFFALSAWRKFSITHTPLPDIARNEYLRSGDRHITPELLV
jgi:hypothetical protein